MKNIFKYLRLVLIGGILITSCETIELDLAENPNALSPSQADPDFFLNAAQVTFARVAETLGEIGADVTRIENMASRNYPNAFSPAAFDLTWERAYQEVIQNIRLMNVLAMEGDLNYHLAIGQMLEAYTLTLLVDYFGDVPFADALSQGETLNPTLTPGADVYAAALGLIDQAIANFGGDAAAEPQNDFYYDGDYDQWILACNTLKLRLYLNTGNITAFNALIATGNYIQDSDDDFQFQWGTNAVQPDTRHPNYAQTYTTTGVGGEYQSIWLMNLMDTSDDPRTQYYFYRQTDEVPGAEGVPPNEETLACSLTTAPAQYVAGGFPFCALPNGFWGRNHGNAEGIPPDGFLRVAPGVYPNAGNFDDSRLVGIGLGSGGGGAGITPLLLSSTVEFWQAEIAMLGSTAAGQAFVTNGASTSIAKVMAFGDGLDPAADMSTAPMQSDVDAFVMATEAAFMAGSDMERWNIMAEQFFISLKGNGHDAYNFYRRRGFPTDIEPALEPDPGPFIRSHFYPANAATNNANITQKGDVTTQVFWDTNPASPTFPVGN